MAKIQCNILKQQFWPICTVGPLRPLFTHYFGQPRLHPTPTLLLPGTGLHCPQVRAEQARVSPLKGMGLICRGKRLAPYETVPYSLRYNSTIHKAPLVRALAIADMHILEQGSVRCPEWLLLRPHLPYVQQRVT